jgi:hypothetical protein
MLHIPFSTVVGFTCLVKMLKISKALPAEITAWTGP